jgi:F-box-like
MNVPSGDILVDGVLLNIFEHLEGADLINCEAVCRRWRNVLKSESSWRGLFQRQTSRSPLWRRIGRLLDEKNYRDVCRAIVQYLQEVNCNLRAGNIKKTVHPINFPATNFNNLMENYVGMADDHFASKISNSEGFRGADQIVIADKSSMQVTRTIDLGGIEEASIVHFDNNVIVLYYLNVVQFADRNTL